MKLCQYDNQTYGINQSIITKNCKEKCGCRISNGSAITTCEPLCQDVKHAKCDINSQIVEEHKAPLNDTNCTCTKKSCVSGTVLFQNQYI